MRSRGKFRLPLLVLECLGGFAGCLPDPRPYDACVDDDSYYAVSPQGCNGHDVSRLAERATTHNMYDEYGPIGSDIAVDDMNVFWVGPEGEVLRTSKKDGATERVLSSSAKPQAIQLESDGESLYVWMTTQALNAIGELFVVDKNTLRTEKSEPVHSLWPPHLQVFDGAAYVNTSGADPCLRRLALDTPQQTCILPGLVEHFEVTETGVYFLSSTPDGRAVQFLPVAADMPTTIAKVNAEVLAFDVQNDRVRWVERNNTSFAFRMANSSGEIGDAIRVAGHLEHATFGNDRAYAVGWLDDMSVSRLYGFQSLSATPNTIAASLSYTTALTTDDDQLYASVLTYDDGQDRSVTRLYRIDQ